MSSNYSYFRLYIIWSCKNVFNRVDLKKNAMSLLMIRKQHWKHNNTFFSDVKLESIKNIWKDANNTNRAIEVINMDGKENKNISEVHKTIVSVRKSNWKQRNPQTGCGPCASLFWLSVLCDLESVTRGIWSRLSEKVMLASGNE